MQPVRGEVSLQQKQSPVCSRPEPYDEHYAYLRGTFDHTAFKSKLLSLSPLMWEDEYQEGNVKITRPAHDAWGIKKIVFTFCDDFLLKVIDLPWSRAAEWRELLLPIYKAIGVDESKVVRCLLASMPPGMTIPVHHDTGYWVKHTHRVHVPLITGDAVDFLVGPTEDRMQRVLFEEGSIIELNNQAKHAVANNMPDTWRVHLIFDYVEEHPIHRYAVQPGERIFQTRRSLDLEREAGSRRAPSFLILGAQKSGTTSLHNYICQHPLVVAGKRRETHYFDWRWNHSAACVTAEQHRAHYMNFYPMEVLQHRPSLLTGESTPSYMLHSDRTIARIKLVCPWAQLLVILRNPVERAYSQYQMCISTEGTDEQKKIRGMSSYLGRSFEDVILDEIAHLARADISPDCTQEVFHQYIRDLPMTHGGHSIVLRGCYSLLLAPWMEAFPADQLKVMSIHDIKGDALKVNRTMNEVFEFIGLRPHDIDDIEPKNTRAYQSTISSAAQDRLERFYAPFNKKLFAMLGRVIEEW